VPDNIATDVVAASAPRQDRQDRTARSRQTIDERSASARVKGNDAI